MAVPPKPPPPLLRSIIQVLGARVAVSALALLTVPIVLHRLGPAAYGVYVITISFTGLMGLFDLGLTTALITHVSNLHRRGAAPELESLLRTAFSAFLAIGVVIGLAFAVGVPYIARDVLHVPAGFLPEARAALWIGTGGFVLNMWLSVFDVVPVALERFDMVAARLTALSILNAVLVIVYGLLRGTLVGFVALSVAGTIVGLWVFYAAARRLLPNVSFRPGMDREALRRLAHFSAFKFAGSAASVVTFRSDQVVIGALAGVGAAGLYAVPANLLFRLQSVLAQLPQPVFPRVSGQRDNHEVIAGLYLRTSRLVAVIAMPAAGVLFVTAGIGLRYWIGGPQGIQVQASSTAAARWLIVALLINALAAAPVIFSEASGRPQLNNGFAVLSAVIHVPLLFILVPRFGIVGAGMTLCFNSLAQTLPFILYATRAVAFTRVRDLIFVAVARPAAAALVAALVAWLLRPFVTGRATLVALFITTGVCYLVAAVALGAIRRTDITEVRRALATRLSRVQAAGPGPS